MQPLPNDVWITGRMGSGKDTLAQQFVGAYGFTRLSLADALKEDYCRVHSITPAQLAEHKADHRVFLQMHGQARREENPSYWIEQWAARRASITGPVVCADLRYLNEALFALSKGFLVVRISVPATERHRRLRVRDGRFDPQWDEHASEADIDVLPVHLELDGTETPNRMRMTLSAGYQWLVQNRVEQG